MSVKTELPESSAHPLQHMSSRVASQDWPKAALYVVATPIGNLGDLSLRAWYALGLVDLIAAEDTRATRVLLSAWGLDTPLMSAHRHNEAQAAQQIIERLAQGQRVALVSDAGAPAVSDPGGLTVAAVRQAGYEVVALPGPSAVITALMCLGVTSDENPAFAFLGFAPNKHNARLTWLRQASLFNGTLVFYEAPHRIYAAVADVIEVFGPQRMVSLARELTKKFEETVSQPATTLLDWFKAAPHREQGEYVVVIHPLGRVATTTEQNEGQVSNLSEQAAQQAWADALLGVLSVRDASKVMAQATGLAKDTCYAMMLARKALRDD
jgi:16S rRNA (cytidine1402-2'-O)-methyltransferase